MNNEPLQQNVTRAKRRALQVVFVTICCLTVLVNFLLAEVRAPDRFHAENTFRTNDLIVDANTVLGGSAANTIAFNASSSTTLNMGAHRITALADPTSAQDAATQAYVLAHAGSGGSGGVSGSGTGSGSALGNLAMWTGATTLGNSPVSYDGSAGGLGLKYPYLVDLDQTVTNAYPIGEILRMKLGSGAGFTTGSTGDIFMMAFRNGTIFDTSAGANASGGAYFEVTSTKSAGSADLTNKALKLKAVNGDHNLALHDLAGDIQIDSGDLTVTSGNTLVQKFTANGSASLGDGSHDTTVGHILTVAGAGSSLNAIVALSGAIVAGDPTGVAGTGLLRANTQNGLDAVEMGYVGGGGPKFWSLYPSSGTLKVFEYTGATTGGGTDRFFFDTGGGATSSSYLQINGITGSKWTAGAGAPASSCTSGDLYSNTSGGIGTTLYGCTATNTWSAFSMGGATPSMTIANATQSAAVNLSTTGTGQIDWLFASPTQQGNSTRVYDSFAATLETKLTGGGLLLSPGIDVIGSSGTNANSNGTVTFSSTASDTTTQTAISSASGNGITAAGVNAGLRFVAPVTTSSRVFRIYNSHSNSTWSCTAHLMDGSVSDKTTTPTVATTAVEEVQTITVTAGSDTNLVVYCVITATSGTAVIKWYAEILSLT